MKIKYKGDLIEVERGTKVCELLKDEIWNAPVQVIACKFNNEIKRLDHEIDIEGELELIDIGTKDGMRIYRRGLIYITCKAFNEIYPDSLLTVNYQLQHALLCEVENMEITDEVIEIINKKVQEIIDRDLPIVKTTMSKEEAVEFYEKEDTLKGRLQLESRDKNEVTLYYCEDYYNYFYGILPLATGYVRHYEIAKYHDGFVIRFPSSKTPTVLDEFKESPKLLETLDEYEDVHKVLNINTVYKLNRNIRENKIREYILLDEALHEKKIAGIADDIAKNKDLKVIMIARAIFFRENYFLKKIGNTA
jgi:uridine kinase